MMEALQWTGFVLVVAGYWRFAHSRLQGALISLTGALPLGIWAWEMGASGVLALQVACALMNLRTAFQEQTYVAFNRKTLAASADHRPL